MRTSVGNTVAIIIAICLGHDLYVELLIVA